MRTALTGRTHGCTDQCCKREENPCQLGAVHTWHFSDIPPARAMAGFDYRTEAELFPLIRRKFTKGGSVGYKRFTSAADAIRFAVEELAPDLLRGAYLEVAEERFDANGIRHLHESDTYPLVRRA
jgi:hypothetical protein